jgi:hypothetical protein
MAGQGPGVTAASDHTAPMAPTGKAKPELFIGAIGAPIGGSFLFCSLIL